MSGDLPDTFFLVIILIMKSSTLNPKLKSALNPARKSPAKITANNSNRGARLEFRLTLEARARIEKAALVNGQTLSDFASSVLLQEANQVLEKQSQRVLSENDWVKFAALLNDPPKLNRALKSATKRYKKGRVGDGKLQISAASK